MTTRTTTRVETFKRPFRLEADGDLHPAGSYSIETDEELIEGVSFPAYRRTHMSMQRIDEGGAAGTTSPGTISIETIDPQHLDAALFKDKS
jgi:hypothetical protein